MKDIDKERINRIQYNKYGDSSVMYFGQHTLAKVNDDEVKVRIKAASVNPLDWKQRKGAMAFVMGRKFPKGIGNDFSGIVEAVGPKVKNISIGDEVFGTADIKSPGAFAEVFITKAKLVALKPSSVSFEVAACLPIAVATAWAALVLKGKICQKSRVLINGCTGAVGLAAVQLAKVKGADVVGTCSSSSIATANRAGITEIYDYADDKSLQTAEKFDIIFDTAGSLPVGKGLASLNRKGKFIDINPTPTRIARGILSPAYKMAFATMGFGQLQDIARLAETGSIAPVIGATRPFTETIDLITSIENGHKVAGRTVLIFE